MTPNCIQSHGSYSRLLSREPWIVVLIVCLLSTISLVIVVLIGGTPQFGESQKYFTTIGTEISARQEQIKALLSASSVARQYLATEMTNTLVSTTTSLRTIDEINSHHLSSKQRQPRSLEIGDVIANLSNSSPRKTQRQISFCRNLADAGADMNRFVFKINDDRLTDEAWPLLNLTVVIDMCNLERKLRKTSAFKKLCQRTQRNCCRNWSLSNFVAFFGQRSTCTKITKEDVTLVRSVLSTCAPLYDAGRLTSQCWLHNEAVAELQLSCADLPDECQRFETYLLLHYIIPVSGLLRRQSALTVLPIEAGPAYLKQKVALLDSVKSLRSANVNVPALAFLIDAELVPNALFQDMRWLAAAFIGVLFIVLLYTASLLLTFVTLLTISLSLSLSYAAYRLIVTVPDFPILNLMAVVVAVAAGADDVFVLVSTWYRAKADTRDAPLEKLVSDMLRNAGLSITVTSLSTAAAFLTNLTSHVAAVRCFSVYATLVVIINLVLCWSLVPAAVVIFDKHFQCTCVPTSRIARAIKCASKQIHFFFSTALHKCFIAGVIKFRIFWVLLFLCLLISALIGVWHSPGFKPLSTSLRPIFYSNGHPFEKYWLHYSTQFGFEIAARQKSTFTLRFVWGAIPADLRHPLVPFDASQLQRDTTFNITSPETQSWLVNFCEALEKSSTSANESRKKASDCPLHPSRLDSLTALSRNEEWCHQNDCCNAAILPVDSETFSRCLRAYEEYRFQHGFLSSNSGVRYARSLGKLNSSNATPPLLGLVISQPTDSQLAANFSTRRRFWMETQAWFSEQLMTAPLGMRHGFVVADGLEMWDMENSIATGLHWSLGLAVGAAAVTMLLTTLNPLLALLAFCCLAAVVAGTVDILVLAADWRAGLTESVILTAAIGLAIDFSMHYGVAFRMSSADSGVERSKEALVQMFFPVSAGALTTAVAGLCVLPATLTVYRQIGAFLLTVGVLAWFVASVMFTALMACLGPRQGCRCQFSIERCICCCCNLAQHRVDKTVYTPQASEMLDAISPIHTQKNYLNQRDVRTEEEEESLLHADQTPCEATNHASLRSCSLINTQLEVVPLPPPRLSSRQEHYYINGQNSNFCQQADITCV